MINCTFGELNEVLGIGAYSAPGTFPPPPDTTVTLYRVGRVYHCDALDDNPPIFYDDIKELVDDSA